MDHSIEDASASAKEADPSMNDPELALPATAPSSRSVTDFRLSSQHTQMHVQVVNGLIHEIFEDCARRAPNDVAVICGDKSLTYFHLNRLADGIARELCSRMLRCEDRVGLYAQRGVESVIGMLAILKAGGMYVPLDPTYPADQLEFIRDDSSITTVLTTRQWLSQASSLKRPALVIDCDCQEADTMYERPALSHHSLAYVIYTSGSTGKPKGVMIEHRSVLGLVLNRSYAPIDSNDCVAHCASPSFDATTWEVWAPLLNGARLLIVPQSVLLTPTAFNEELVNRKVTAMFLTVGLFNSYVNRLTEAFSGLKFLLVGGDTLAPSLIARALAKPSPPRSLTNIYGPTETTTFASMYQIPGVEECSQPLPIGRAIANAHLCIMTNAWAPARKGIAGEICIGGTGVARGYSGQPALTADRFVADPFSSCPGERLYRTGDVGRLRPDDNIEYLGRNDRQVKIRGFRIELEEVEAGLLRVPGVTQAVVVTRGENASDRHLVAYVTGDSLWNTHSDAFKIRLYLQKRMPPHMVPARVVILTELPLTPNGKVDRRSLPISDSRREIQEEYVAARSPTETTLCDIWAQLLNLDRVGVQDDFFELGGDSLLGLSLIDCVEEVFEITFPSVTIFECPSVASMSQLVDQELLQASPLTGGDDTEATLDTLLHNTDRPEVK